MENDNKAAEAEAGVAVDKKFKALAQFGLYVIMLAAAFYALSTRVAICETQIEAIKENANKTQEAIENYSNLAQSIDSRLSRLEGALGVTQVSKK